MIEAKIQINLCAYRRRAAAGAFPFSVTFHPIFLMYYINFKYYKMHHQNEDGTVFLQSHIYNNASVPLPDC